MRNLTDKQLGYVTGIIDGEGYLGISRTKKSTYWTYSVRFDVANTKKSLIEYLIKLTGLGQLIEHKKKEERHKTVYYWRLKVNEIKQILPIVKEILFIKKEQAKLILEFLEIPNKHNKHSPIKLDEKIDREIIYEELKELNKRGNLPA